MIRRRAEDRSSLVVRSAQDIDPGRDRQLTTGRDVRVLSWLWECGSPPGGLVPDQVVSVVPATCPIPRVPAVIRGQGLIGVAQLAIGLAMLAGYRRSGVWGGF